MSQLNHKPGLWASKLLNSLCFWSDLKHLVYSIDPAISLAWQPRRLKRVERCQHHSFFPELLKLKRERLKGTAFPSGYGKLETMVWETCPARGARPLQIWVIGGCGKETRKILELRQVKKSPIMTAKASIFLYPRQYELDGEYCLYFHLSSLLSPGPLRL